MTMHRKPIRTYLRKNVATETTSGFFHGFDRRFLPSDSDDSFILSPMKNDSLSKDPFESTFDRIAKDAMLPPVPATLEWDSSSYTSDEKFSSRSSYKRKIRKTLLPKATRNLRKSTRKISITEKTVAKRTQKSDKKRSITSEVEEDKDDTVNVDHRLKKSFKHISKKRKTVRNNFVAESPSSSGHTSANTNAWEKCSVDLARLSLIPTILKDESLVKIMENNVIKRPRRTRKNAQNESNNDENVPPLALVETKKLGSCSVDLTRMKITDNPNDIHDMHVTVRVGRRGSRKRKGDSKLSEYIQDMNTLINEISSPVDKVESQGLKSCSVDIQRLILQENKSSHITEMASQRLKPCTVDIERLIFQDNKSSNEISSPAFRVTRKLLKSCTVDITRVDLEENKSINNHSTVETEEKFNSEQTFAQNNIPPVDNFINNIKQCRVVLPTWSFVSEEPNSAINGMKNLTSSTPLLRKTLPLKLAPTYSPIANRTVAEKSYNANVSTDAEEGAKHIPISVASESDMSESEQLTQILPAAGAEVLDSSQYFEPDVPTQLLTDSTEVIPDTFAETTKNNSFVYVAPEGLTIEKKNIDIVDITSLTSLLDSEETKLLDTVDARSNAVNPVIHDVDFTTDSHVSKNSLNDFNDIIDTTRPACSKELEESRDGSLAIMDNSGSFSDNEESMHEVDNALAQSSISVAQHSIAGSIKHNDNSELSDVSIITLIVDSQSDNENAQSHFSSKFEQISQCSMESANNSDIITSINEQSADVTENTTEVSTSKPPGYTLALSQYFKTIRDSDEKTSDNEQSLIDPESDIDALSHVSLVSSTDQASQRSLASPINILSSNEEESIDVTRNRNVPSRCGSSISFNDKSLQSAKTTHVTINHSKINEKLTKENKFDDDLHLVVSRSSSKEAEEMNLILSSDDDEDLNMKLQVSPKKPNVTEASVVLTRLKDPVRVTSRRGTENWNRESRALEVVPSVKRCTFAIPEDISVYENSIISNVDDQQDEKVDQKFLYLKPGKSWQRSLSILNHIHNDDIESLSVGKGRKWRQSVKFIRNMQSQGQQLSCVKEKKNENDKYEHKSIAVLGRDGAIESASPGRFVRRVSIRVVPNDKRIKINEEHDADTSFLQIYGIPTNVDRQTIAKNPLSLASAKPLVYNLHHTGVNFLDVTQPISPKNVVLERCDQTDMLPFTDCYPDEFLEHCRKIGEGVYGEVFLYENNADRSVLKIIPIEGKDLVNGEPQKKFDEILSEIIIAKELHNLRFNDKYRTNGFVEVKTIRCLVGRYPRKLIDLWRAYDEEKTSDNDCPDMFDDDQLYVALELGHGGLDLEAFIFQNASEAHILFLQTALTLAVAEKSLDFEHRDLHWGNVLISRCDEEIMSYKLGDEEITVPSKGVKVAIIDFTLSRMSYQDCCMFNDLAQDPALFTAIGEYQFEIYRLMKDKIGNNWQLFEPYTNILWLHYTLDKMITAVRYKKKTTKIHKNSIQRLQELKDIILDYDSAFDFVTNCETLKELQRNKSDS